MKTRQRADDGLRALIVDNLRLLRGSVVHWQPIESPLMAAGIPDLEGCWCGRPIWVECKATSTYTLATLTEFQIGWAVCRARSGGTTWIATRRRHGGGPRKGEPVDQLWLHRGDAAPRLREFGLSMTEYQYSEDGGPPAWDWERFGLLLFT